MAAATESSQVSRYPTEKAVKEALDMLKPPGILSKAYNQFQLKRYQALAITPNNTKLLFWPIASEVDSPKDQSELKANKRYQLQEREHVYKPVNNWSHVKELAREDAIRKNHLVTSGEESLATTWKVEKPKQLDLNQDTTYFLAKTTHPRPSTYDRINHVVEGYNQKLHRDDREHAKSRGLTVNSEEVRLSVPVLSSSNYGHPRRTPLEFTDRKHARVEICKKDFLRLGGTNIGDAD